MKWMGWRLDCRLETHLEMRLAKQTETDLWMYLETRLAIRKGKQTVRRMD